ncbi:lipopolysaccharide biosynthesis protein [Xanthomonas hortorum pv. vitians]|uniref:lipopolysaccharide biosynthesis protein n=1 Tax=Xanthomonas hortorum TaxID=56454 RepID=UPI00145978B5|nr:lipopolysaccharide biosynthesis protein [Xanthomonas hortorum]MCC8556361.1 lipopolysaccharide biosynthesis protein [Xanthomonas hortorum pv. gardneri]MCE4281276.1 lipopolysaccharide biosynthesis protein [Xanthomonas hortorum pv. vitians]MCE4285806.1 lipopolysaccharide biosynthesis protein [Xanthomonas hortorum pv. vitians]MCE4290482.1 lipopolysaccharide biosynthesis protein [Xanthomonas hortorum pv. vitians]MCE4294572.1 lipopolysaccharide biosynthesis protein [Xanthomonas hortorum pv. vitia
MTSPTPPPPRSLGSRAAGGAAVTMIGQSAKMVVQFGGIILLARLLTPYDYGLMAMVTAIVGAAEILRDFGLSAAAVQAKHVSREQRDNLFWINSGIGLSLSVVVYASAHLIANFYKEPALVMISQALAVTFLINGMTTQYRAHLSRGLRFGQVALSDVGSQVLGLVAAVAAALLGWGYWALVVQQVVQASVNFLIAASCSRWLPRGYQRAAPMRDFMSFGWNLMAAQLLGYASRNVGQVIIGWRTGPDALGLYNRAFQLLMMPLNQINAPATSVALPVLSQLQDDRERFNAFLLRGQTVMVHLIFALFAFSCALAMPLIVLVLGEQWRDAVPLFQVLTLGGIFQTASYATYWVFLSKGLMRQQLIYSLVGRIVLIGCIFAGSRWGAMGVAIGYSFGLLLIWPLSLVWIGKISDAPVRSLFTNALRPMVAYGVAGGCAYYASVVAGGPLWQQLAAGAGAMAAVCLLALAIWPAFRRDVLSIVDIRKLLTQAKARR